MAANAALDAQTQRRWPGLGGSPCGSVHPLLRTKGRVFLVAWDAPAAEERAATLRAANFDVDVEYQDGEAAYKRMAAGLPDVAVFDLSIRPFHGLATAKAVAGLKGAADTTFIFLSARDRSRALVAVPSAHFTTSEGLLPALEALGIPERLKQVIGGLRDTELHEPPAHGIGAEPEAPLSDPLSAPPEEA